MMDEEYLNKEFIMERNMDFEWEPDLSGRNKEVNENDGN